MHLLQINEATATRRRIPIYMVDATDGFTPETGLTITVTRSKNGGAFAAGGGTVTELANGHYYYEASAADLNTEGFLIIRATAAGARDYQAWCQVLNLDPYANTWSVPGDAMDLVADAVDSTSLANNAITSAKIATDAIGAAQIAANAIGASELADNAITAAKIATDAITSAKIAADAIGASELATDAVAEIVDAVWDELTSGHTTAGTTGKALIDAAAGADPAAIADAVLDEALSGHTTAGSLGKAIADIEVDTNQIQGKLPTNFIMGSGVASNKDDEIDAIKAVTDTLSLSAIADAVWDELTAGHTTAGTTGKALIDASTGADPAAIADAVLDEALSGHTTAGSLGKAIADIEVDTNQIQGKLPTNFIMGSGVVTDKDDEIDAIKAKTDNLPADPASETNVNANEAKLDIIDATVDAIKLSTDNLPPDPADASDIAALFTGLNTSIPDAVWDEALAGHAIAGSSGEALAAAGAGGDPAAIADAVLDEALSGHTAAGSLGKAIADIETNIIRALGLAQENYYLDGQGGGSPTYDGGGRLTAARIRIYSDAASVGTASNVVATYHVDAVYSGGGLLTSYSVTKQ